MTEAPDESGGIAARAAAAVVLVGFAAFVAVDVAGRHFRHRPSAQVLALLLIFAATAVVLLALVVSGR